MFKVNDYVMYASTGVCQVIDITKEKYINGDEIECYVLQTVFNDKMTIKTPVNNRKVLMRRVMTKEAALSMLASIPEMETVWINDDRQRGANYKAALKTGKCEDCMQIIKDIYLKKKENSSGGKKIKKSDEEIMKAAEKQLFEEVAIALDISPNEVAPYILEYIS